MEPIKTIMVGIGGYGAVYLDFFKEGVLSRDDIALEGVVDPYAAASPYYEKLKQDGIPFYNDLTEFYKEKNAELAIISTPIHLHRGQCETALANGSVVLCEKPLVTRLSDFYPLKKAEQESGKRVGVAFQWSFSQTMLLLKKDILDGKLGNPIYLKTLLCWPRDDGYYTGSTWKGRLYDVGGNFVNDSILSNATAHYLHNIFFLMGGSIEASLMPGDIKTELYRAKDIETYDTCFMKGRFPSGAEFFYGASHAGVTNESPVFSYVFENATVELNESVKDNQVRAKFPDGSERVYGDPFTLLETSQKVKLMLDHIRCGSIIPCGLETVYPHIYICDSLSQMPVTPFPENLLIKNKKGICCPIMDGVLHDCYENSSLPSEMGYAWATKPPILTGANCQDYI